MTCFGVAVSGKRMHHNSMKLAGFGTKYETMWRFHPSTTDFGHTFKCFFVGCVYSAYISLHVLSVSLTYELKRYTFHNKLDESTSHQHLKSPPSLSGRSLHLTLLTKGSQSWSWMTYSHPFCSMSISPPILRCSYFKIWQWKSLVKAKCVVKSQDHIWP